MLASVLLDECRKAGIDFYAGVPDSFLKGLCDELFDRPTLYGYYDDDRNFIKHPFYAFLTAEQDYFTTKDLKLTDEQIKELIAQVVPMLDGYSLREIGTLEDL